MKLVNSCLPIALTREGREYPFVTIRVIRGRSFLKKVRGSSLAGELRLADVDSERPTSARRSSPAIRGIAFCFWDFFAIPMLQMAL